MAIMLGQHCRTLGDAPALPSIGRRRVVDIARIVGISMATRSCPCRCKRGMSCLSRHTRRGMPEVVRMAYPAE
jgi:hypothetical protein